MKPNIQAMLKALALGFVADARGVITNLTKLNPTYNYFIIPLDYDFQREDKTHGSSLSRLIYTTVC
jgi:trehalose/maltose hydrolase-like predicted phosphorylase